MVEVVLVHPQIPQNTGNIARTCAVTSTPLKLIEPLGFSLSERQMKRAGLDYWEELQLEVVSDMESWLEKNASRCYFFSSKASKNYSQVSYKQDSILVFGSETSGFPESWYEKYEEQLVTIPMKNEVRCLNLATSTGIGLYEALRQTHFSNFKGPGSDESLLHSKR